MTKFKGLSVLKLSQVTKVQLREPVGEVSSLVTQYAQGKRFLDVNIVISACPIPNIKGILACPFPHHKFLIVRNMSTAPLVYVHAWSLLY